MNVANPTDVFWERFREGTPFPADHALMPQLRPDTDVLFPEMTRCLVAAEAHSLLGEESGETLAMLRAFGSRLATTGMSPTGFSMVAPAMLEALNAAGTQCSKLTARSIAALCAEGYVAGFREAMLQEQKRELAAAWVPVEILPKIALWVVAGPVDPDTMSGAIDGLGRFLLKRNAAAVIIYGGGVRCETPNAARALLACDGTARILGVRCIFANLPDSVVSIAKTSENNVELLEICADMPAAVDLALPLAGLMVRSQSWIPGLLRGPAGNS